MAIAEISGVVVTELSTLIVERDRHYLGFLSRIRVLVDGAAAGKLGLGESVSHELSPGEHQVRVASGWLIRSRTLKLRLEGGTTTRVRCRFRGNPVTAIYWGTFAPGRAIILELFDEAGRATEEDRYRDVPDRAPVAEWLKRHLGANRRPG